MNDIINSDLVIRYSAMSDIMIFQSDTVLSIVSDRWVGYSTIYDIIDSDLSIRYSTMYAIINLFV